MTPTHAKKGARRYRYYVSLPLLESGRDATPHALRLPANTLEDAVQQELTRFLKDESQLVQWMAARGVVAAAQVGNRLQRAMEVADQLAAPNASEKISILQLIVKRVSVHQSKLEITVHMAAMLDGSGSSGTDDDGKETVLIEAPMQLKRCGTAMRMMVRATGQAAGKVDPKLIGLIGRAHDWFARLTSGRNDGVMSIAQQDNVGSEYVSKVINLAFLAPDIVQRIHKGEQPPGLNCDRLIRMLPLPLAWEDQRKRLGMSD